MKIWQDLQDVNQDTRTGALVLDYLNGSIHSLEYQKLMTTVFLISANHTEGR